MEYGRGGFKLYQEKMGSLLDKYENFILEILKVTSPPPFQTLTLGLRIKEVFPDFNVSRASFYELWNNLERRRLVEIQQRYTVLRGDPVPGEEAQVDFGQDKMKDMYGIIWRVYFFIMDLKCLILDWEGSSIGIKVELKIDINFLRIVAEKLTFINTKQE